MTQEDGAADLVHSERMKPYLKLALAKQKQSGVAEVTEEIKSLPLEQRYVWRIASALKWAFQDCDAESAMADRLTMITRRESEVKANRNGNPPRQYRTQRSGASVGKERNQTYGVGFGTERTHSQSTSDNLCS